MVYLAIGGKTYTAQELDKNNKILALQDTITQLQAQIENIKSEITELEGLEGA